MTVHNLVSSLSFNSFETVVFNSCPRYIKVSLFSLGVGTASQFLWGSFGPMNFCVVASHRKYWLFSFHILSFQCFTLCLSRIILFSLIELEDLFIAQSNFAQLLQNSFSGVYFVSNLFSILSRITRLREKVWVSFIDIL